MPILAKILTSENIHPFVRKAEYAVRGELAIRSEDLKIVRPTPNTKVIFQSILFSQDSNSGGQWRIFDTCVFFFPR